jgi:sulfur carrier protein
MQIIVNGEARDFDDGLSLEQLLERLELSGKRIAVELNETIVPRARHAETVLEAGDKIEIIHAIGGG